MLTPKDNLCESCTNIGCIFQSGIVRKECAFYMPPHIVREFEEIVVNYPPEDLCTYPEYKGKPYFGIKYKENGEEIVGYGTYKPEVLSRYLKDYFMATTKEIPNQEATGK
jgi:hypothetical protein